MAGDLAAEAKAFLKAYPRTERIDALIADGLGSLRGVRMPIETLGELCRVGIGLPGSVFALDITGATAESTGLGFEDGDADRDCLPVPGRLTPVPWLDRPTAQVLLAMRDHDGGPFFADPRSVLQTVVSGLAADGLTPVAAIELEFYLIDREPDGDGRPRTACAPSTGRRHTTTQVYGIEELDDFDDVLSDIEAFCLVQGIPAGTTVSEYAPGQFEINLKHGPDPVRVCDDAVLFKRAVKGAARKHGMRATFMSKPFADRAGSGTHIHLSVLDRSGQNIFAAEEPQGSTQLRHAIGGLAATMPECVAIFAQNANAFRRFGPNSYAPHAPTWAVNNRSAALRIPASEPAERRLEHRVAGADANPYLVMAAVLAGAHYGLRQRLDPGPAVSGNAYRQIAPTLTSSWLQALDLMAGSRFASEFLGDRFVEVFLALKRAERARYLSAIHPIEHDWYLDRA